MKRRHRHHTSSHIITHAREVAGISHWSQSVGFPFVVGSHGGFGTCAKQVWALLVQCAKLVAARDWRQSWSAIRHDIPAGVAAAAISCDCKAEATGTLLRVPLIGRQAAMGAEVFGEGGGGESGGAGYAIRGCVCRSSWA